MSSKFLVVMADQDDIGWTKTSVSHKMYVDPKASNRRAKNEIKNLGNSNMLQGVLPNLLCQVRCSPKWAALTLTWNKRLHVTVSEHGLDQCMNI